MNSLEMPATEFDFTLPKGLVVEDGTVHRQGRMRLATARDEILLQKDRRVKDNPAYGTLVRLSYAIAELGSLSTVTPEILENLFALDLAYLQEFYNRINQDGEASVAVHCPACNHRFRAELELSGES